MTTTKAVAAPFEHGYKHIPDAAQPSVIALAHQLLNQELVERMMELVRVIDSSVLDELQQHLAVRSRAEPSDDRLKPVLELVQQQHDAVAVRQAVANKSPAVAARRAGELKDLDQDTPAETMQAREHERRFHAERLWKRCGVFCDFDSAPFGPEVDTPELKLQDRVQARVENGRCDGVIRIERFVETPRLLAKLAVDFDKKFPEYRDPYGAFDHPVHFVRELRFMGHGLAPSETEPSGFVFDGTFVETQQLGDPRLAEDFAEVRSIMAPGAGVLFDGCSLGRGEKGKAFLGAFAALIFGDDNWGFLRANTDPVSTGVTPSAPLRPVEPLTVRWPDDFV